MCYHSPGVNPHTPSTPGPGTHLPPHILFMETPIQCPGDTRLHTPARRQDYPMYGIGQSSTLWNVSSITDPGQCHCGAWQCITHLSMIEYDSSMKNTKWTIVSKCQGNLPAAGTLHWLWHSVTVRHGQLSHKPCH